MTVLTGFHCIINSSHSFGFCAPPYELTSHMALDLDGSTPEPAIGSGDTVQRIPCYDSCQLITTLMCNMRAISVFLCSQTSYWDWTLVFLWCGRTGGRADGRCTVTWLPNFLRWVDLLTYGAPQARFARQSSANSCLLSLLRRMFYDDDYFWWLYKGHSQNPATTITQNHLW